MEFVPGKKYDFGTVVLSELDIIDFAKAFDPLEFHTDKEAAERSHFKGLIASGPHIFNLVHRTKWIPLFGKTVICGLEVSNWKFLKPIFANKPIHSSVTILDTKPNYDKKYVPVKWFYEFRDEAGELLQSLEMTVLHKL
ncbi:MAG TPA: MaoC/PaaZ C-terminal domain-containing protein [Bacteroidia bacterium]|jgi:acyl dehydratase